MALHTKNTGRTSVMPVGILLGVASSLIITLIGSGITAWLILLEKINEEAVGYFSGGILLLAAATGAWVSWMRIRKMRLQVCLTTGAGFYLTLLAMTAMFFGGIYTAMGITAILVFIGSVTVGLMGIWSGKTKKSAVGKRAYR